MTEEKSQVLVTIQCLAYNHAKYIRQCLDGFVMQKTNFRFEAIVHDDASTDGTANIIREYEKQYPDIIIPIYQEENQYSKHNGSIRRALNSKTRGKYVAICEGDDYWIDPNKLQKQVDFLEAHPKCTLMVSNGYGYYESKKKYVRLNPIPTKESRFITMHEVLLEKGGLIPTASMCFRREMTETEPDWCLNAPVGDRPLRMWCAINGTIFYDVSPMVVYRKSSVGSFTQHVNSNYNYARHILDDMNVFFDAFDDYTYQEYHSEVQYMKDREEFYFYFRVGDYHSGFQSDYFKSYPIMKQMIIRLRITLRRKTPVLYDFLSRIKKYISIN